MIKCSERLNRLTDETLIVEGDITKKFHVARAHDIRGFELGETMKFNNSISGYLEFENWINEIKLSQKLKSCDYWHGTYWTLLDKYS